MRYRFNRFEIDTSQYTLFFENKSVAIEPKSFDLLVYLLENRSRTMSREEILNAVWSGTTVCDATLSNHIKDVRKILGDNGDKQEVIKTMRSRGYQFVAQVDDLSVSGETSIKLTRTVNIWKPILFFVLLSTVTTLIVSGIFFHVSTTEKKQQLVVLPFKNIKSDAETEYLSFAIADQIIGNLATYDELSVRASASVRKFTASNLDPLSIAQELDAEYILTGSFFEEDNIIHLAIEFLNADTNSLVWRDKITSDKQELFNLQIKLSRIVAEQLNLPHVHHRDHLERGVPQSPLAYEFYLRGLAYPITVEGATLAIPMLERSLQLEDNFAPALVEMAFRVNYLAVYNLRPKSAKNTAIELYKKALEIDPNSTSALSGLADIYTETGRIEKAVEILRDLLARYPQNAQAHFSLGYSYRFVGATEESIAEMELARSLDPHNPKFRSIGLTYTQAGLHHKALEVLDEFEDSLAALAFKSTALIQLDRFEEALAISEHIISVESNSFMKADAIILKAILTKDHITGLKALKKLEAADINDAESNYYWARYYAVMGDKEGCYRLLRRALENGYFNYPFMLKEKFFLDSIRNDPEFGAYLEEVKQKHLSFLASHF